MAKSAIDAINQDRKSSVDDVWVDEEWAKENIKANSKIGFADRKQ